MAIKKDPATWDRIVTEWKTSPLTKPKFCAENDIKPHQLDYQIYRRRRGPNEHALATQSKFVRVLGKTPSSTIGAELVIDSRIAIRTVGSADPHWIATLVREVLKP